MKLEQIIDSGARKFIRAGLWFGHGTDNAWDEAAWLAAHVLQKPLPLQEVDLETHADKEQQDRIEALFQQRIETRQPAAYLINEAWFCGLKFYVDQRVLVPRSPVAELIHDRFEPWMDPAKIHTILDVGTGSGCIAIACARFLPHTQVTATDISAPALDVARINVKLYDLEKQVKLLRSDLFNNVPAQPRYDLIISNPPYVETDRCRELPAEYQHEPETGLASGITGLAHAIPLLENAARYLSDQGALILEVGESQQALEEHFPSLPFNWIQFTHGGEGVCLLHKQDLLRLVPS